MAVRTRVSRQAPFSFRHRDPMHDIILLGLVFPELRDKEWNV